MAAPAQRGSWRARPRFRAAPPSAARRPRDLRSAGWTSVGTGRSWSRSGLLMGSVPRAVEYRVALRGHDPFNGSSAPRGSVARGSSASRSRHASTTRAAIASAENSSARARPSTRGSSASRCGRSAARQASRSHGAQYAPSIPCSATGWIPTGVPNAGTPHASASITDSPKPSSADGTSTALAALIQYGTSSGGDAAQRQQRHVARRLDRAVVALERPRRVVREQQVRAGRIEPEPLARLGARDRPEAVHVDPDRQHGDAALRPGARQVRAELARDRGGERRERQRRARREVRAAHEQVVPVQRHDDRPEPREHRRPRRQPEVRVHDVEPPPAVPRAQRARRAGERPRPGPEREQLDVEIVAPPQRLDLVAHERAERRPLGRRIHVRDHEHIHWAARYPREAPVPGAVTELVLNRHRFVAITRRSVAGPALRLDDAPHGAGRRASRRARCTS